MRREFVEQRGWLTDAEFLDLLGAVNLIPGPNSTQLAMQIGKVRAGTWGLIVAGFCFILPAALIVTGLAWAYVHYGTSPSVLVLMLGIKPVVVAVVVQAVWKLVRANVKSASLGTVGIAAAGLVVVHVAPLAIVFGSGLVTGLTRWVVSKRDESLRPLTNLLALVGAFVLVAVLLGSREIGRVPFSHGALFLYFGKIGAILYGSGYVLLAYLNTDLVHRFGWLTRSQLLDAVAVGQFTPGPVFTTATFIGYLLGGPAGAVLATIGIFLPSFVFVTFIARLLPGLRQSVTAGAFMDGVNVASLALMAVVAVALGRDAIRDWLTVAIFAVSLILLVRLRLNSAWILAGGGLVTIAAKQLGIWYAVSQR